MEDLVNKQTEMIVFHILNDGSVTKYEFAEKKIMGIYKVMKDDQEVWN